jgi:hypothetical protein
MSDDRRHPAKPKVVRVASYMPSVAFLLRPWGTAPVGTSHGPELDTAQTANYYSAPAATHIRSQGAPWISKTLIILCARSKRGPLHASGPNRTEQDVVVAHGTGLTAQSDDGE